jgi:hypothetical protein
MRRARRAEGSSCFLTRAATDVPSPIVVEVYAPQPRPQELAVLIAACSRAAAPNECITSDVKSAEPPLGVAIVRREGERARIEVGLRGVVSADWSTRDLIFQPGDDELERCRAIGFAIGTLVARQVEPPAPPPPEPKPKPPPDAAEPSVRPAKSAPSARRSREPERPSLPAPRVEARARSTWLDFSGGLGLGLIPGPPRVGGVLRAGSELSPAGFFGSAEIGYAERAGDPQLRVRWLNMALGLGHPLAPRLRAIGIDLRLLVALERVSFTAVDGERSDSAARWKPGLAGAIDGHWDATPALGLVVSVATQVAPARTVIRTGGNQAGETPGLGLSGFIGLRLKLK